METERREPVDPRTRLGPRLLGCAPLGMIILVIGLALMFGITQNEPIDAGIFIVIVLIIAIVLWKKGAIKMRWK